MITTPSFDKDFIALLEQVEKDYPGALQRDGIGTQTDIVAFTEEFFHDHTTVAADVSIDSNANVTTKDTITYHFEVDKPRRKLHSYYLLWQELCRTRSKDFANRVITYQIIGAIYINDAWDLGRPYCFNYSTFDIALGGLPMGDKVKPVPPKHLATFMRQVEQFATYAANSTLGATGLADILIIMAWYAERVLKTMSDDGVRFASHLDAWAYCVKALDKFIYTMNWQFRGNQSPFTNISLYDKVFLEKLCGDYQFPDGTKPNPQVVMALQLSFMDIMNHELRKAPLTFPVTTACFAVDKENNILDFEFAHEVAEANLEFGFINIYCGDSSTLSSCCRLRSGTEHEYFNSFGAGSSKIGSLGVGSPNLPRLASIYKDDEDLFLERLKGYVRIIGEVNNAKREIIKRRIKKGALPLYTLGFMDLKKQYSTCGVVGLYEALEILGYDILTPSGQEMAKKIIATVNATNKELEAKFGYPHNCEQVPGENSNVKLAEKDHVLGFNKEFALYSNQFIPLTVEANMLERIELQGMFDKDFSGGAICHLNVCERITDPEKIVNLIVHCAKAGVVYWAINYALARCPNGCEDMEVTRGDFTPVCPVCGTEMDVFTRVVGFLTNVSKWNKVRRSVDWPHRQFYSDL